MAGPLPLPLAAPHAGLPGLHLRRLHASDAAAFRAAVTTPEIGRMLFRFPADWPLAEAETLIAEIAPRDTPPFRLAISAADGGFLGSVGLVTAEPAELAYFLTPAAQGQGIMRAVLDVFVAMVFAQFDLPALRAQVYHDNPASMALLRKLGFVETGSVLGTCSAQRPGPEWQHAFCLTRSA